MKLHKFKDNPILSPNPDRKWEALVTTNPAAYYDEEREKFILLYRAAGKEKEHKINLALAESDDGFHFTRISDKPIFDVQEGDWDGGSIEDPRIVKIDDCYFITYATVPLHPGQYWTMGAGERNTGDFLPDEAPWILTKNKTRTGLAITKDFKKIYRPGYLTDATVDDRDVIIFPEKINGKFVILHRPMDWIGEDYGTDHPAIWLSLKDDLLEHPNMKLLAKAKSDWEYKIGGAAPPIKTEHGWFILYHAVGKDKKYRVGAMLLDLEDPTLVKYRTRQPILEPDQDYECNGIYKGICFPCGNVVKDDTLYVYYGGADQYCCVATCNFSDLLTDLMTQPE